MSRFRELVESIWEPRKGPIVFFTVAYILGISVNLASNRVAPAASTLSSTSVPANSPSSNFGNAAAAIIAALSVDNAAEGNSALYFAAAFRKPELHATPPEMIIDRAPISSADRSARRSSSSITVR